MRNSLYFSWKEISTESTLSWIILYCKSISIEFEPSCWLPPRTRQQVHFLEEVHFWEIIDQKHLPKNFSYLLIPVVVSYRDGTTGWQSEIASSKKNEEMPEDELFLRITERNSPPRKIRNGSLDVGDFLPTWRVSMNEQLEIPEYKSFLMRRLVS